MFTASCRVTRSFNSFLFSAAGGEIFDQCVADRDEAFSEKDVQRLMRQILEGVHFLHTHHVIHLDLKVRLEFFIILRSLKNDILTVKYLTMIYSNLHDLFFP